MNEDDLVLLCGGRDIAQGRGEGEDEEKAWQSQSRCSSHLLPLNADAKIVGSGAVFIYKNQRCGQAWEAMG